MKFTILFEIGLKEGILNRIEEDEQSFPDTNSRLRQALEIFQSEINPQEIQDSRNLIEKVHLNLQEAEMFRLARIINETYLL